MPIVRTIQSIWLWTLDRWLDWIAVVNQSAFWTPRCGRVKRLWPPCSTWALASLWNWAANVEHLVHSEGSQEPGTCCDRIDGRGPRRHAAEKAS